MYICMYMCMYCTAINPGGVPDKLYMCMCMYIFPILMRANRLKTAL